MYPAFSEFISIKFVSWNHIYSSKLHIFMIPKYFKNELSTNQFFLSISFCFFMFPKSFKNDVPNLNIFSFSWVTVGPPDLYQVRSFCILKEPTKYNIGTWKLFWIHSYWRNYTWFTFFVFPNYCQQYMSVSKPFKIGRHFY